MFLPSVLLSSLCKRAYYFNRNASVHVTNVSSALKTEVIIPGTILTCCILYFINRPGSIIHPANMHRYKNLCYNVINIGEKRRWKNACNKSTWVLIALVRYGTGATIYLLF